MGFRHRPMGGIEPGSFIAQILEWHNPHPSHVKTTKSSENMAPTTVIWIHYSIRFIQWQKDIYVLWYWYKRTQTNTGESTLWQVNPLHFYSPCAITVFGPKLRKPSYQYCSNTFRIDGISQKLSNKTEISTMRYVLHNYRRVCFTQSEVGILYISTMRYVLKFGMFWTINVRRVAHDQSTAVGCVLLENCDRFHVYVK